MDAFLVESGLAVGDATFPFYDFIDWGQCGPNSLLEPLGTGPEYQDSAADAEVIDLDLGSRAADVAGAANEAVKGSISRPTVWQSSVSPALPEASNLALVAPTIAVSVPAFPVLKRTRAYTFVQEDPSRPKPKRRRKVGPDAAPKRANKKARPAPTPVSASASSSRPSTVGRPINTTPGGGLPGPAPPPAGINRPTVDPLNQVDPSVASEVSRARAERRLLKAFPKPLPNASPLWCICAYKEIEADLVRCGKDRVRELQAVAANPARLALQRRELHSISPESDVEAYGPVQWTGGPPLDIPEEIDLMLRATWKKVIAGEGVQL